MDFKIIPAHGPTVKGIDIYYKNAIDDFKNQAAKGIQFCFHKASEGITFQDPKFRQRWLKMKTAFPVIGAYHYFHPAMDPLKQAQNFFNCVKPIFEIGDMLWMDWESTDGIASAKDRDAGFIFLQEVEKLLGSKPGIYSGPYFLKDLALDQRFASYTLWVSEYGVTAPKIPAPFTGWQFWQTGEDGVDFNLFNGTIIDLKKLALK